MTREILFRGFHEDKNGSTTIYVDGREVKGEWVEGWLATITTRISHINVFKSDDGNELEVTTYPVITSTIGQYTGLNDKNGKKIFKGDNCWVMRTCILVYGCIKFKAGSFYFNENHGGALMYLSNLNFNKYKIEVTGTIFDKPRTDEAKTERIKDDD